MTPDQLRQSLASAGISQLELARRIGVDGRTVRYWLAGRGIPENAVPEIMEALKPRQTTCPECGHSW